MLELVAHLRLKKWHRWISTVLVSLQTLDARCLRPLKHAHPARRQAQTTREDKLILVNSNTSGKRYGTNSLSQGSHLDPLEETNPKHPPHRCQLKDSGSKTQHLTSPSSSEAALPFQCRCSMKVVIPQLTDLVPRHGHRSVRLPGRRHSLFNTTFYNITFFLPGTQHDFTGTVQSEYYVKGFFKILCIIPSALQNNLTLSLLNMEQGSCSQCLLP